MLSELTDEQLLTDATQATMSERRVRVAWRLLDHMKGSQAYTDRDSWPQAFDLIRRIEAAPARADRSRHLAMSRAEQEVVYSYAEMLALAARDDAGPGDPDATADLNTARAALRALAS